MRNTILPAREDVAIGEASSSETEGMRRRNIRLPLFTLVKLAEENRPLRGGAPLLWR